MAQKDTELFYFNDATNTACAFVDGQLTFYGGKRELAEQFFTMLNRLHDVRPAPNGDAYTIDTGSCRKQ